MSSSESQNIFEKDKMTEDIKYQPHISIIIPVRNEQDNIAMCLKSIDRLDYPKEKIEVIVVDNGSIDNTVDIALNLGAKVYVDECATIAGLRNLGVLNSNGEIIGFVDADIIVLPTWISAAVPYFLDENNACVGASPELPENSTWVEKSRYLNVAAQPEQWQAKWICSMNMFVRRTVFDKVGGFNEDLVTCEDVDFGYRVCSLKGNNIIIRDKKIRAIHTGEAKNLLHLFRKERWRAISNYSGIKYHGIIIHELPSLFLPIVGCFFLVLAICSALFNKSVLIFSVFILFFLPAIKTVKVILATQEFKCMPSVYLVQCVYFVARMVASGDSLYSFFKNKCKCIFNATFDVLRK